MKILLVDDDTLFSQKCIEMLDSCNHEVHYSQTALDAKEKLYSTKYDLILLDIMLPPTYNNEGFELLGFIKDNKINSDYLFISAKESINFEKVSKIMSDGCYTFIDKNDINIISKIKNEVIKYMNMKKRKIFISHGHNELLKLKLCNFINKKLGIETLILSEQPSEGMTVVEKLEKAKSSTCYAIILMTKDDETIDKGFRARQNVVHELGFFQGAFGRKEVLLLAERGLEIFSNISGIVRVDFEKEHFESIFEVVRTELSSSFPQN